MYFLIWFYVASPTQIAFSIIFVVCAPRHALCSVENFSLSKVFSPYRLPRRHSIPSQPTPRHVSPFSPLPPLPGSSPPPHSSLTPIDRRTAVRIDTRLL